MAADEAHGDIESIIQFADDSAKDAAFDHYWTKVECSAPGLLDLGALRICVRLLPLEASSPSASKPFENLNDVISRYILAKDHSEDHLYSLAEICLDNVQLGSMIFDRLARHIAPVANQNAKNALGADADHEESAFLKEEQMRELRACYRFLKCSYWLPEDRYHYITSRLLSILIESIGSDDVDAYTHDVLSALLSLLTRPSVVVLKTAEVPDTWIQPTQAAGKPVLRPGILSDLFFDCFRHVPENYFSGNASKAFRTWFQWITYLNANLVETDAAYSPQYWSALRAGLVTGMADQRKYCLGIMQQTLISCQRSFQASGMCFDVDKKAIIIEQYKEYCALFEIVVLDRYPNQVQACLPKLTTLLGRASLISPTWTTALLAAALNPKIQEGVRKLVGNWYLDYAITQPESCTDHITFLVEGFLPWATQGSLFSSTLVSTRVSTECSHGVAVTDAFARLVVAASGATSESEAAKQASHIETPSAAQAIVKSVLQYISDSGGRIFSPAVLCLLEGLLKGISQGNVALGSPEIDLVLGISRLPSLPEIAADLCRTYCAELCRYRSPSIPDADFVRAQAFLDRELGDTREMAERKSDASPQQDGPDNSFVDISTLNGFLSALDRSQHKIIQNEKFAPGCAHITAVLEKDAHDSFLPDEVLQILEAFWEEADRQDYCRPVAIKLAPLFFHPVCIATCLRQRKINAGENDGLTTVLTKALTTLHRFAEGRSYLVSTLASSLRKAAFAHPEILDVLPFEDFFVRFIKNPPVSKKEFLFEMVAAEKLQERLSHLNHGDAVPNRNFEAYYGQREWSGYAALIDLLNRMPEDQLDVARRVMKRILEPWRTQEAPIPIISKWKNVLQLQVMLVLAESCVSEEDVDWYLDSLMHALILEPWPRYRYLLEWIISRIYYRFPSRTQRILDSLACLDENSPVHIASLIKLALLIAPILDSEDFALKIMVQLIPFSASPKIHIRHESHWSFPTLFDLAKERNWTCITSNPAFVALDMHVRKLDKFNAPPSTIRTLKLDAIKDFTLTKIFQGRYLRIETPDMEYIAHEDFAALPRMHDASTPRVSLGQPLSPADLTVITPAWKKQVSDPDTATPPTDADATPTFHQTKSGFDIAALLPNPGLPSLQNTRPASVILVASLIDNPTNLGGLSRIAESFGLSALYISDLKARAHKDFRATSVTSEKHLPIHELKVPFIPEFLRQKQREGYTLVGIEQTDRSAILGSEGRQDEESGILPHKCVLVLGAERSGITAEVLAVLDRCVEIRTVGVTRSLNVQTAGGIAVYEWWRSHYPSVSQL